jgi:hypothetical protein
LVVLQQAVPRLRAALATFLFIIGSIVAASAQTPIAAVDALLNELRAQGAEIRFDQASPGPRDSDVRLSNLSINRAGFALSFATLDLSGVRSDKAHIAIDQARGERILMTVNVGNVSIAHLSVAKLLLPRGTVTVKGQSPFQSLVGALRQVVATEFEQIALDDISWKSPSGAGATLSAARIDAGNLENGNVARIVIAQPRRVETSADRVVAADEIAISNLNPMRIVESLSFEPQPDAAREWKSLADVIDVKGFSDTEAAARTAIDRISLSGLRLRRLAADAAKYFDLAAANPDYFKDRPDEARPFGDALMDIVRLDRLSAAKLTATDGKAPVPRLSSFESLAIADLDFRGAAAITLDAFQDHRGANGMSIRQTAIARLELVETGSETAAGAAPAKIPFFGGVSIHDASWVLPGGAIELRALEWSAADRVGLAPTRLHAKISGLSLPTAMAPDPGLRASLIKSGVSALMLDADLSAHWDDVLEQIVLDHASLGISNLGQIELSGTFVGAQKTAFQSPQTMQAALWAGSLKDLQFKFTDAGLSNRLVGVIAQANKRTPEQVREALTTNMPTLLGAIPDTSTRDSLIFALAGHLNDPQTLELTSLARTPVPVAALASALRTSPSALPGLLKLDARATHTRCFAGSTKACRDDSANPN